MACSIFIRFWARVMMPPPAPIIPLSWVWRNSPLASNALPLVAVGGMAASGPQQLVPPTRLSGHWCFEAVASKSKSWVGVSDQWDSVRCQYLTARWLGKRLSVIFSFYSTRRAVPHLVGEFLKCRRVFQVLGSPKGQIPTTCNVYA